MNRNVFVLTVGFLLAASCVMGAQVTNVELAYQDGSTVVRIDVQGAIRFTHSTEVPKEGRPDRVIVDILSATHELGGKEFLDLPSCVVTGIRSSQYAVSPEKIVRVVLDVTHSPIYRVESDDRGISIYIEDKTATPFPAWSSTEVTGGTARDAVVPESSTPAAAEVAPSLRKAAVTVAEKNEQIEDDRQASLAAETPSEPVQTESTEMIATETESESATSEEPVPQAAMEQQAAASEPQPVPAPARRAAPSVKELMTAFGQPSWAARTAATETALPKSEPKIEVPVASTEAQAPPLPMVVQQTPAVTPEPVVTPMTETATPDPPKTTEPSPSTPVSTPASAEKTPAPESDSAKPVPADFLPALPAGTADEMASEQASTDKLSTARFRRSSASSIKAKGTMVAEFPQRLVIKYESDMYRDPFATLLDDERTYNSPVEQRIPNIEGLKLVGVLEAANAANRALFEDKEGYSYILKSGDKVRGGYVLRVEVDRVYFQIFEYGWSRTVELTME